MPADTALEAPVHLRFVSTGDADMKPAMSHPRVLVVLNDGSRATIVESHTGPDGIEYFTNAVTEIVLGEHAFVDYYRLQHESTSAYHVGSTYVVAGRHAECSMHRLSLGAALVRDDLATLLGAERGACTIDALSLAGGRQTFDAHTIVDHAMPECSSRQRYKGILGGEARGSWAAGTSFEPRGRRPAGGSSPRGWSYRAMHGRLRSPRSSCWPRTPVSPSGQ